MLIGSVDDLFFINVLEKPWRVWQNFQPQVSNIRFFFDKVSNFEPSPGCHSLNYVTGRNASGGFKPLLVFKIFVCCIIQQLRGLSLGILAVTHASGTHRLDWWTSPGPSGACGSVGSLSRGPLPIRPSRRPGTRERWSSCQANRNLPIKIERVDVEVTWR